LQISRTISSVSRSSSLGRRSRRYMRRVTLSSLLASDGVGTLSTGPQENPKGADWSAALAACIRSTAVKTLIHRTTYRIPISPTTNTLLLRGAVPEGTSSRTLIRLSQIAVCDTAAHA
jgi:hypothetical protein